MKLSEYDLRQLDEERINNLTESAVKSLSITLLNDLKELWERLNQNSKNSSVPPSSTAPWDKASKCGDDNDAEDKDESKTDIENLEKALSAGTQSDKSNNQPDDIEASSLPETSSKPKKPNSSRKPGKQPGAQGFGRVQKLTINQYANHYPCQCALCHRPHSTDHAVAYTAFDSIDIKWGDPSRPGIEVINTRHTYFDIECSCGHVTRETPHSQPPESLLPDVELSEWRLIAPGLATLIVCLKMRMRLSCGRIQEWLDTWLGIALSVGSINKAVHETGRAAMPLEDELVDELIKSDLLHIDETPWYEKGKFLWLWVFVSLTAVVFWVGERTAELITNVLGANGYKGWIMSDGYRVYRQLLKRLRCWAHLVRKAKGLVECLNKESQVFGQQTLDLLNTLMGAVNDARETSSDKPLSEIYRDQLINYRQACEKMASSTHKKTRALAGEMLNDWEVIFIVLDHPHLPLTNNEAERALRHWVILRKISYGTRTDQGSRIFAILASVIETCRIRRQCPWRYLESVITNRRAGLQAPPLPVVLSQGV